jgi:hypothetical protein
MAVVNYQGALRTYILADATVSGLIGTKMYAPGAPQDSAYPYTTLFKVSDLPWNNLNTFDEIVLERYQIDIYSKDIDVVTAIKKAIFDRLHFKNYISMSGYKIYLIRQVDENYFPEPEDEGTEKVVHRISVDFQIKRSYEPI